MLPYLLTVSTIRTSIFYGQIPITSSHWHPGKGGRYPQKIIPHPNTPPNKKTHVFYMGVSENSGVSPQIIHFNRVFYYFHHPFWGVSPYFWKRPLMMHLFFSANRPSSGDAQNYSGSAKVGTVDLVVASGLGKISGRWSWLVSCYTPRQLTWHLNMYAWKREISELGNPSFLGWNVSFLGGVSGGFGRIFFFEVG